MVNATNITALPAVTDGASLFTLIVGLALVIVAIYVVYKVVKNLIANAIAGGIGLLLIHFIIGPMVALEVPITLGTILLSLIAGLPGLVLVVVFSLLGIAI